MDKTAIAKLKWNPSTHCSAFRTDTERLLYFVIDWLEPLSIFGSSVFNWLQEQAPVWWYVFSIAFRSSGSWQVDSTSWVCWSRTVKHVSVFLGFRSRCRTFKQTSWSLKRLARVVVSHDFETHFAWSVFKTLGILHFLQYYQTPFGLAVLQDGRADFQTGQQAFMGHLITLWLKEDSSQIETAEFSVGNLGVQGPKNFEPRPFAWFCM